MSLENHYISGHFRPIDFSSHGHVTRSPGNIKLYRESQQMQELPQKNRVAKIKTGQINGASLYFYMEKICMT